MKLGLGIVVTIALSSPGLAGAQSQAYFPPSPSASSAPESEAPIPLNPALGAAGDQSSAPQSTAPQWVQTNALSPTGSKTCGMNADLGNSWNMSLVADLAKPSIFTLTITGNVSFPSSDPQRIVLYYDKGFQALTGTGSGNSVSIPLDSSNFPQFLHGFTAGRSMQISEGIGSPFNVDLTGTSAAISALGQCTIADDFTQLPPPWHAPPSAAIQVSANSDASPIQTALLSCRSQTDSLLRLRCYDAISVQAQQTDPSPPGTVQSPSIVPDAPSSAGSLPNQQSAPTAAAPSQTSPPDSSASNGSQVPASDSNQNNEDCKDDWQKCKDNADLANNYSEWATIQVACQDKVNDEVEYGTPKWPGFWSGGSFTHFLPGTDYISTGIAVAIEPNVQIANQYGAMVHSTAFCRYDLNAKAVLDVSVSPN